MTTILHNTEALDAESLTGSDADTEACNDYEYELTVAEVLSAIHIQYPKLDTLQHALPLAAYHGIHYATHIHKFSWLYYVHAVGMSPAAVDQLFKQADAMRVERRSEAQRQATS
jgi:hypothetical protein